MNDALTSVASSGVPLVLVGVGGVGARLICHGQSYSARWPRWVVDSDAYSLALAPEGGRCCVGMGATRGLGCGGDLSYARDFAEASVAEIQAVVGQSRMVVLVAGIAGGVGGGMAPVVARCARASGASVVAVAIEPFDFESRLRRKNADQSLLALEGVCDVVLRISNQAIARVEGPTAPLEALWSAANQHASNVIEALAGLMGGPALIPVGFAELERWLRARQEEGIVAHTSAEGEGRARTLWSRLASHPLLDSGARLREAGGVLLRVAGGPDLRRDELEEIQRELEAFCPQAQLLIGASVEGEAHSPVTGLIVVVRQRSGPVAAEASKSPGGDRPLLFRDASLHDSSAASVADSSVTSRESSRRSRPVPPGGRKSEQQQFEFVPVWSGRFDNVEGTLHEGENLDEPTFLRRGIRLN